MTRLVLIGDRETSNLEAIVSHINQNPDDLILSGIMVPFNEMDMEIMGILDRLDSPQKKLVCAPLNFSTSLVPESPLYQFVESSGRNLAFFGEKSRTDYIHIPYSKGMSDEQREFYCKGLLEVLNFINPDLIFLSNYKAILHKIVPEAFENKIINVHPSVLPLNKGWRTEKMALDGINPDASGYTFHIVVPQIDEGPALFSQKVSIEGHDEESLRLTTIISQSYYTPKVLSLYASNTERKILKGAEAFEIEERPFNKEHGNYRRMVFRHNGEWKTMEKIFKAPEYSPLARMETIRLYMFAISGSNADVYSQFAEIIEDTKKLGGYKSDKSFYDPAGNRLICELRSLKDISSLLELRGLNPTENPMEVYDRHYAVLNYPVGVHTKRVWI